MCILMSLLLVADSNFAVFASKTEHALSMVDRARKLKETKPRRHSARTIFRVPDYPLV